MHDSYSQAHEDEHLRFGLSEAERLYQHRFSAFLFENESGPQLPAQNTARTPKRRNQGPEFRAPENGPQTADLGAGTGGLRVSKVDPRCRILPPAKF